MMPRGSDQLLLPVNPVFMWSSLLGALALNLIPLGRVAAMPDFLALVVVFWNVHQPRRVGVGAAFVFGLLMARFAGGRLFRRAACLATILAAGGALVALQTPERTDLTGFVSILSIAAIVVAADGLRLRSPPWLTWAADMSFALFITHALVGAVWFGMAEQLGLTSSWLVWGLDFMAALTFAGLFHRFVDHPIQLWIREQLARPRPTQAPDGHLA